MEIGNTVLVTEDGQSFEATIMGFAGDKVRVDWTEKKGVLFNLFNRDINHSKYVNRNQISVASFEDPFGEFPTNTAGLWEECRKLGWIGSLTDGRWEHGEHKQFPCYGEVGVDGVCELKIKAKDINDFLTQALEFLRTNSKDQ